MLPAPDALEDVGQDLGLAGRDQQGARTAHDFFRRVAEQSLRPPVPARNRAVEALTHDGVVRRFHKGRKTSGGRFSLLARGEVADDPRGADDLACRISDRGEAY